MVLKNRWAYSMRVHCVTSNLESCNATKCNFSKFVNLFQDKVHIQ